MITDHVFRPLHKKRLTCAYMSCQRPPDDHARKVGEMAKDGPDYPPPPRPQPGQEPPMERKGRKTS